MEERKRKDDREQSGHKNQDSNKYRHHFEVKNIPKGLFQLFNKSETYIYEKKFSCELPKNIIPPKSFHYPFSLENFCQSDLLTMDFDLKKNQDILTDPKINTFIHQDFINNSLELIFPNLTTIISKKRTEEEQNFKKKIIEIIERNDEVNQDFNPELSEIPDFLRRQTYLRPSVAVNNDKKSKTRDKGKTEKKEMDTKDLIKCIEQSFNDIDKIKVGMKHPDSRQKGVTAKNVYELSVMDTMPNINFVEYLFPSEPSDVPNLNKKYLKPDHFLIKSNMANNSTQENTCSLYINNKLKTQEDHVEKDSAEYYTYEREFAASKMSSNDLFNRYFLILDKTKKKLKISRLSDKFSFRRYKKMLQEDDNKEGNENKDGMLNKKRKRDVIILPQNISKKEIDEKNKWLKERGYMAGFSDRKVNINRDDADEIEKERQKEEEELNQNNDDEIYDEEENENEAQEEREEKDLNEFGDDNENENDNDNANDQEEDNNTEKYGDKSNRDENEDEDMEGEGDKSYNDKKNENDETEKDNDDENENENNEYDNENKEDENEDNKDKNNHEDNDDDIYDD